jgi:hypothetical protein
LQFAVRQTAGSDVEYSPTIDTFKPLRWLGPYARNNSIRLASAVEPYESLDHLAANIRSFIHRYLDSSATFESVAVLYVLHTWVYERFQAVPYLRFMGISGSGKTRATETIGALCYRPLVIAGSATPAPMYRQIEAVGGTILLDEADFQSSQIGSDIIKVLNCGYQKGLPVSRMEKATGGEFVPRVFDVFGPKIINGRQLFSDDATESRCLAYTPPQTTRTDIPRQLSANFEHQARKIRNQALGWRFDVIDSFEPEEIFIPGLRPRTNQIITPLLMVAERMGEPNQTEYRNHLLEFARKMEEQAKTDSRGTVEAMLVQAFVDSFGPRPSTCKELVDWVLRTESDDPSLKNWLTPKKASIILRNMGFETSHTNRGSVASIEPERLNALKKRYGIEAP